MPKSEPDNLFAGLGKADEHPDVKQLPPPKPNHIVESNKMVKPLPPAPHNGTATSRAAAMALDPEWQATQCGIVFAAIKARADATREELTEATGLPIQTICGRVDNLLKMELIYEPAGVTRPTKSGRQAQVVRAVK
jgi:hypothetical protein